MYILSLAVLMVFSVTPMANEKYVSVEGKFKIRFPKDGKIKQTTKDLPGGLKVTRFQVGDQASPEYYAVSYMDCRPEAAVYIRPKELFDGVIADSVKEFGGKLLESDDRRFRDGNLPARKVVVIGSDGKKTSLLSVLDGARCYVVCFCGNTSDDAATAFINSFEITK
jgi:hypothetical protein